MTVPRHPAHGHRARHRRGPGRAGSAREPSAATSAGQHRLLALARAELVDPDILLRDEATSWLDLATDNLTDHPTTDALVKENAR